MKLLVYGDCIEFGWLISAFIPYARLFSEKAEKTVVLCKKGNEYLYEFANDFEMVVDDGACDRWLHHARHAKIPERFSSKYKNYFKLIPTKKNCLSKKKRYVRYGQNNNSLPKFKLIIHARAITRYHTDYRNWGMDKYKKVIDILELKKDDVCSIGTNAYHIPGTTNLLNINLSKLCSTMRLSKVILTPSSGPAHLASLCGLTHVVMTDRKKQKAIHMTNKKRYENLWNPYGTKCVVLDEHNWNPPVSLVIEKLRGII